MLLNFPYHRNWYQEAQNSSNCLHRWLLTAVLCGWRIQNHLELLVKMLKGSWWSFWNGSTEPEAICALWAYLWVFCQRSTDEPFASFCFVCACISYEDVYRAYPFCHIDEILYWPQARLLCPTYQNDPDRFAQLLLRFRLLQGACGRSLDRDSGQLLVARYGTLTACHPVRAVVSDLPETWPCSIMQSYAVLLEIYINLWGRGTSSWAVSI